MGSAEDNLVERFKEKMRLGEERLVLKVGEVVWVNKEGAHGNGSGLADGPTCTFLSSCPPPAISPHFRIT